MNLFPQGLIYGIYSLTVWVCLGYAIGTDINQSKQNSFDLHTSVLILCILISIFINIVIHEIGHFLAGRKLGLRLEEFKIGPFRWTENTPVFRPIIDGPSWIFTAWGYCKMAPQPHWSLKTYVAFAVAGPLSNLIFAAFSMFTAMFLFSCCPEIAFVCRILGWCSFAFVILNLWPFETSHPFTDGYRIAASLVNSKPIFQDNELLEELNITAILKKGVRPKDLEISSLLNRENGKLNGHELLVLYWYYLDQKDFDRAYEKIGKIRDVLSLFEQQLRTYIVSELAYSYAATGDRCNGIKWLSSINFDKTPDAQDYRVLAYCEFYLNHNPDRAIQLIRSGLNAVSEYALPGLAKMEEMLLRLLESEIEKQH